MRELVEVAAPGGDFGIEVVATSTGVAYLPRAVVPALVDMDEDDDGTVDSLLERAALWVDETEGRSVGIVLQRESVVVTFSAAEGPSARVEVRRRVVDSAAVSVHAALRVGVCDVDRESPLLEDE